LILLDIHLEGKNGFEVCKILKENSTTTQIPVIFLTADLNKEIKFKAFDAGASDYITKPFDSRELTARVGAALKMQMLIHELAKQANTDSLTGLLNRNALMQKLQYLLNRQKQDPDFTFAAIFLDFDRFKLINDSLGHDTGDELLVLLSKDIISLLGSNFMPWQYAAARMGGDEFIILIENPESPQALSALADSLQEKLQGPYHINQYELICSASMGIVTNEGTYTNTESFLRDADIAMYKAKDNGKSQYCFFDAQMHIQSLKRLTLEGDLRHALAGNQLVLHYQPIVNMATGKLSSFEALIRWNHPVRGTISPLEFIPIAEETGLIVPIGWWVLYEAASQLKHWQNQYPAMRHLRMNVNVSKRQVITPNFVQQAGSIFKRTHLNPKSVTLEITESTIMGNMAILTPTLTQLRKLGFKLAIDDFGTGHSSLGCLNKFPLDSLKIDRSFISNVEKNHSFAAILNSIVTLAHNLNLNVVAEGIEKLEQLTHLQSLDCDYGQGYLFARPTSAKDIPALFEELQHTFKQAG